MEIDTWKQELTLTLQRLMEMDGRTLECSHGDLKEKVRDLEKQLGARAPEQADWAGDLEDAQAQLEKLRQSANEYREQVTQIPRQMEGRTGDQGHQKKKEEKCNKINRFSGEDRIEHRGWKVQFAQKMAGKPRTFATEQKKLRYRVG
jgi:chromosome segregation ATPase